MRYIQRLIGTKSTFELLSSIFLSFAMLFALTMVGSLFWVGPSDLIRGGVWVGFFTLFITLFVLAALGVQGLLGLREMVK